MYMNDCPVCGDEYDTRQPHNCSELIALEQQLAELKLEIIAATGQAQTALEENAKLKEALKVRREEANRKHAYQLELEAENAELEQQLAESNAKIERLTSRGIEQLKFDNDELRALAQAHDLSDYKTYIKWRGIEAGWDRELTPTELGDIIAAAALKEG